MTLAKAFLLLGEAEGVHAVGRPEEPGLAGVVHHVLPAGVAPSAWNELKIVIDALPLDRVSVSELGLDPGRLVTALPVSAVAVIV